MCGEVACMHVEMNKISGDQLGIQDYYSRLARRYEQTESWEEA